MCHISSGKVKTSMLLIWAGPDGEDIYDNFNLAHTKQMMWTMYYNALKNFVSQPATLEQPDLNSLKFLNIKEKISIRPTTEY